MAAVTYYANRCNLFSHCSLGDLGEPLCFLPCPQIVDRVE